MLRFIFTRALLFCTRGRGWGGGGVLSDMGYIGMCGPMTRVSGFSAILVTNRVWYLYSSLDMGGARL